MNHIKKTIKSQQNRITKKMKSEGTNGFYSLLAQDSIQKIMQQDLPNYRNRLYNPLQTLSMFLTQALDEDSSCQNVVNTVALNTNKDISITTGGYCRARQRLHVKMVKNLTKQTSKDGLVKVPKRWKFQGRYIYLVDGTTFIMPDTQENQEVYPQQASLPLGLGFPICRAVGIISLYSGTIVDACVSPYQGKGASEQVLLRGMLHNFKNGARAQTTDFTKGDILGKKDHIITLKKPVKKPNWMNQQEFDELPKTIRIRELYRGGNILITTMLCKNRVTSTQIKNLYKHRWQIEVDFRNIKSTLGLKSFSCKTPEMVIKEMWVYFLAYNLIRLIMLESAIYNKLLPRQFSFKHTVQILKNTPNLYNRRLYKKILYLIGQKIIGNREGRIEPRAIKRRHNDFPLLMKTRDIRREEIRKYGHPKKLK
jgi:hypothetical protein